MSASNSLSGLKRPRVFFLPSPKSNSLQICSSTPCCRSEDELCDASHYFSRCSCWRVRSADRTNDASPYRQAHGYWFELRITSIPGAAGPDHGSPAHWKPTFNWTTSRWHREELRFTAALLKPHLREELPADRGSRWN